MTGMEWLAYCRAGFESELGQELMQHAAALDSHGYIRASTGDAYVRYVAEAPLLKDMPVDNLVFGRQSLLLLDEFPQLDATDRLAPIRASLASRATRYCDVFVEAPDSEAGAELKGLSRSFEPVMVAALRKIDRWQESSVRRLHLLFVSGTHALLAEADVGLAAPWRMGIPRLRQSRGAPSRSSQKLDEAWLVLLNEEERTKWLQAGMTAVDLGAAPGGWTFELARRSIRVIAVDNGPMAPQVLDTGVVTHVREDGFRYRPRRPVDWLVCDMVEQPVRVAGLVAAWLRDRNCRFAIFNLKLPMKKRYHEVARCLDLLQDECGLKLDLRAKQLYHDREEITVFARVK